MDDTSLIGKGNFPLHNECKFITNEFRRLTIAYLFATPFDKQCTDPNLIAAYNQKIDKPMDLSTVIKRIDDGQYLNFQQWYEDMSLIFSNAITYNGQDQFVGGIAVYLQKKLDKKVRRLQTHNARNYQEQLQNLVNKLDQCLDPPPSIGAERIDKSSTDSKPFTIERLSKLKEKLSTLAEKESSKITRIIKDNNPSFKFDKETEIDLASLGKATLLDLEQFANDNNI